LAALEQNPAIAVVLTDLIASWPSRVVLMPTASKW
jgi:hypothetical protein